MNLHRTSFFKDFTVITNNKKKQKITFFISFSLFSKIKTFVVVVILTFFL